MNIHESSQNIGSNRHGSLGYTKKDFHKNLHDRLKCYSRRGGSKGCYIKDFNRFAYFNFIKAYQVKLQHRKIISSLFKKYNKSLLNNTETNNIFREEAETFIFKDIKSTLRKINIKFDLFFNENTLYENKAIYKIVDDLKTKNLIYKKDGAIWFSGTKVGRGNDRVLIKSTGEPTYRLFPKGDKENPDAFVEINIPWEYISDTSVFARTLYLYWDESNGIPSDFNIHKYKVILKTLKFRKRKECCKKSNFRVFYVQCE